MTKRQRENIAKYLYDISKIIFTLAVLGNLLTKEKFDILAFLFGIIFSASTFISAFILDKKEA